MANWSMPLPAGLSRRFAIIAGLTLATIWFWVFLRQFDAYHLQPTSSSSSSSKKLDYSAHPIIDVFDVPPIDSSAIKEVCSKTVWNPNVVFTCDNSIGGIGNVRNSILHCVRYAIAAGVSLVVPRIIVRNAKDIAEIRTGERSGMDYMFDTEHFLESLRLSCPQLRVYNTTVDQLPSQKNGRDPIPLFPESLITKGGEQEESWQQVLDRPEDWRDIFWEWLKKKGVNGTSNSNPHTVVELARSYLQYPIYSDGESFAHTFGGIMKFRRDTRILATKALLALSQNYSFPIDLSCPEPSPKGLFLGAHLRTENDAAQTWGGWEWQSYEKQSQVYLEQAVASNTSLIYVASGDLSEVTRFASDTATYKTRGIEPFQMRAISKSNLLHGADLKKLDDLAFDQQGLVDFLVMLKASDFAGIGHSSFAWNIALKRHLYAKKKDHLDGPQLMSDEFSLIYGYPRQYPEYAQTMWP
jgi:hypothetical protein